MEEAGLGLAVLAEVRTMVSSMKERWKCYKDGPARFATVDERVTELLNTADKISDISKSNPEAFSKDIVDLFRNGLKDARNTVKRSEETMDVYCSNAFTSRSSDGAFRTAMLKGKRMVNAKSLAVTMGEIEKNIKHVDNLLQHLLTQLVVVLHSVPVNRCIHEQSSPTESYRPEFNAPGLAMQVRLDFCSRDAKGKHSAPEGKFKYLISTSASSSPVTAATGAPSSVHAVSGMAGVGKTISLAALGHDADLKKLFSDGILYMSLGGEATADKIIVDLDRLLRLTGATSTASKVKSASSLKDAVAEASIWFRGRRVLFLFDDIWPAAGRPEGHLNALKGILNGSPDSRIAITTRSRLVASRMGSHVDFGARDPQGPVSVAMFMAHAAPNLPLGDAHCQPVRGILKFCAGLPIALAVTGQAVAFRVASGLEFQSACHTYFEHLSNAMHPGATILNAAISISLLQLDEKIENKEIYFWYSFSDMYASLCILKTQEFAPVSVLARMWKLDVESATQACFHLSDMSLAKMSSRTLAGGEEEIGIVMHDLHLDFCQHLAEQNSETQEWHRRLLNEHINQGDCLHPIRAGVDVLGANVFDCAPRPWWSDEVENKEYIRINLSRHLRCAGLYTELAVTMLNINWMKVQACSGGILALQKDLETVKDVLKGKRASMARVQSSIQYIQNLLMEFSLDLREGLRVISFILLSHLYQPSLSDIFLRRFLEGVKKATPIPFLLPIICTYRPPRNVLKRTLIIRHDHAGEVWSADMSNCEKYIAAGTGMDIQVSDVETTEELKRLKGHKGEVRVVKFSSDSSRIFSGADDSQIFVWDWTTSDLPSMVLNEHTQPVYQICLSTDESRMCSVSQDTGVKVWNMGTGKKCAEYSFAPSLMIFAVCANAQLVAVARLGIVGPALPWIRCIDLNTEEEIADFESSADEGVQALSFSPEGRFLVVLGSQNGLSSWSTASWEKIAFVRVDGDIRKMVVDASGMVFLDARSDGIYSWSIMGGEISIVHDGSFRNIRGLCSNGNVVMAAYADGCARIWSIGMSSENVVDRHSVRDKNKNNNCPYNGLRNVCLSDDGTHASAVKTSSDCSEPSSLCLWNAKTGEVIAKYRAPVSAGLLALGMNGKAIATTLVNDASGKNDTIQIWNPERPPEEQELCLLYVKSSIGSMTFSPDGKMLFVAYEEKGASMWDLRTKQKIYDMDGCQERRVLKGVFCSGGARVTSKFDEGAIIWNSISKKIVFDSTAKSPQELSLQEAKRTIASSGSSALYAWPFLIQRQQTPVCPVSCACCSKVLDVRNIMCFLPFEESSRKVRYMFCEDVLVANLYGTLSIFRLVHDRK